MTDCIDSFKTGECGCNNCNLSEPVKVLDSRGDCTPRLDDPNHIFSHGCKGEEGGDMTVKAPQFELTVENPPDDVLRNPDGSPVLVNGEVVAANT